MRKKRKALIDNGFISSNGVCFGNDITLRYTKPHESVYFSIARALFALAVSFATMCMFASFILKEPSYAGIFLCCFLSTGLLCVAKVNNKEIRTIAIIFLVLYFLYFVLNYTEVSQGFFCTVSLYLEHAKQPSSMLGTSLNGIHPLDYPELASFFMNFLSSVVSIIVTIACVFRIDFPMLFIITFPLFELGMYHGWEAPLVSVVVLVMGWVILISLHTINQRTNKAGRKNTFAVHEKKHTYYLTSETEKSKVFFVLMRFIALLCAAIFILTILLANLFGHERSETVERYRKRINNFIENFSLEDLGGLFADYDGGFDFFGTKAVGGTNGGKLGDTDGINFNGTTALVVDTAPFKETLYLRGYVAGDYNNNQWDPVTYNKSESFAKKLDAVGVSPQDINYFELTDLTNLLAARGEEGLTADEEISVKVKGASKKFVYAPYASYYTASEQKKDYKMRPYLDSYVKLGSNSYSISYRKPNPDFDSFESVRSAVINDPDAFEKNNTLPSDALESYNSFVKKNYSKVTESEGLRRAYNEIESKYLKGVRSYNDVVVAINMYFSDNNFQYSLEPGKTPKGRDFVDYFLSEQKKGYCSYYASAGVQLLRMFGFQARFVEGYVVLPSLCDQNAESCSIDVTDKCAHAWTEVYFENYGWVCVDFTPGYDNDNPNMTEKEKHPIQTPVDNSSSQIDSSSASDSSSESTPDSSSSPDTSSSPDSSQADPSSSPDSASPGSNSSDQSTSGYIDHRSAPDSSGSGTVTSNIGSDTSIAPYPPQNDHNAFSSAKIIIAAAIMIAAFLAVMLLRRILLIRTRERNCLDGEGIKRLEYILKYSIKYLKLLDLNVGDNITDEQLCDQIHEELAKKDIHIGKELKFLFSVTQDAYMGKHEPSKEELDRAYEYLNYIARIIVKPNLSPVKFISAMLVNCMY